MKKLIASGFAAVLVTVGLVTVMGGNNAAGAADCYPAPAPVGQPECAVTTTGTATTAAATSAATTTAAVAPLAKSATTCSISATKKGAALEVSSLAKNFLGGYVEAKFHKVGTPGSKKQKLAVQSYSAPVKKLLSPGLWHGTFVYFPVTGSDASYCGVKFLDLRVKK